MTTTSPLQRRSAAEQKKFHDAMRELLIGALAAEVTARAVISAIHHATGLPGLPAARDLGGLL